MSGILPGRPPAHSEKWPAGHSSWDGTWMLVVMNADGSAPVNTHIHVGITAPSLGWISAALLGVGTLILLGGVLLIAIPMSRTAREHTSRQMNSIH